MKNVPESEKGKDCDFCALVREVQNGARPINELLDHPLMIERLRLLIIVHCQELYDVEELTNELRVKVSRVLSTFVPDYAYEHGKFFSWLRTLVRDSFADSLRDETANGETRWQNAAAKDAADNSDLWQQSEERVRDLESIFERMPEHEQIACNYYFRDCLSAQTIADLFTATTGYPCTAELVLLWIRNGLRYFFLKDEGLPGNE